MNMTKEIIAKSGNHVLVCECEDTGDEIQGVFITRDKRIITSTDNKPMQTDDK